MATMYATVARPQVGLDRTGRLLAAYREGNDRRALARLFSMHGGILRGVVLRYRNSSGESYEDLLQVGHVGLMKAIGGYDPGSRAKFSTYAHAMVEGEIRHHLRDSSPGMRRPRWARSLYAKVAKANAKLMAELGRPPLTEELAREVNVTPEGIEELMKLYLDTDVRSLDESRDGGEAVWGADLSAIKSLYHETFSLPIEDRIWLEEAMQSLSELQRKVLQHLYYDDLSQTETGEKLGLSQRKVSRIAASSIRRLGTLARSG